MDEYIVPAFTLDEAEALSSVEPFHCAFFFHKPSPEKAPIPHGKRSRPGAFVKLTSRSISQAGVQVQPVPGNCGLLRFGPATNGKHPERCTSLIHRRTI